MKKLLALILILALAMPAAALAIPDVFNEPINDYAKTAEVSIPADAVYVGQGTYAAGDDIPVGIYRVDTDCFGCYIKFDYPDIRNAFNLYFGKNYGLTTISRLPMVEGSTITIEHNGVYFTSVEYEPFKTAPFTLYPGIYFPGEDFPAGTYYANNASKYRATAYLKKKKWPYDSIFTGDITEQTKLDCLEDTFVCILNFPVSFTEYCSPFS